MFMCIYTYAYINTKCIHASIYKYKPMYTL